MHIGACSVGGPEIWRSAAMLSQKTASMEQAGVNRLVSSAAQYIKRSIWRSDFGSMVSIGSFESRLIRGWGHVIS